MTKIHPEDALLVGGVAAILVGVGAYDWRAALIMLGIAALGALAWRRR